MRTTRWTSRFKRDVKRELKGTYRLTLQESLTAVISLLESDQPLPERMRDHALGGDLQDVRDCHLHPDLVLLYRKVSTTDLELIRVGSHSELGI